MLTTVHYFTRRAARERRLAREALTETARQRHASLADHFASLAQASQHGQTSCQAVAVGQE
jgi:hypothetical protein